MNTIKGYKVTDKEGKCRGYLYEVGKTYSHEGKISLCNSGFHFCIKPSHCFNYYDFISSNKVFEIEAWGDIEHGEDKSVTNNIKIIREIEWQEVLFLVNDGKDNAGHPNTGYSNKGNWNTGGFCTGDAPFPMFNKPSNWTEKDFIDSKAYSLLCEVETKIWVPSSMMTNEEKEKYPSHKTAEGYLKDIPYKEAFQNKWHSWSANDKEAFTSLPNFDAEIFKEITGVDVQD